RSDQEFLMSPPCTRDPATARAQSVLDELLIISWVRVEAWEVGRMLRPWVLLGSLTAALVSGVADADAARRVALIIGNNNYEKLASLNNPAVDAERMASLLAGHGFQVMSCDGQQPGCFDLGRSDLEDALEEFEEL